MEGLIADGPDLPSFPAVSSVCIVMYCSCRCCRWQSSVGDQVLASGARC